MISSFALRRIPSLPLVLSLGLGCGARTSLEDIATRTGDEHEPPHDTTDHSTPAGATTALFVESEPPVILLPETCHSQDAAPVQPTQPALPMPAPTGSVSRAECGNGRHEEYESCDDGNLSDGDGCSSRCQIEAYYVCPTGGARCVRLDVCGDGTLSSGEVCDDGNLQPFDGCSPSCQPEVNAKTPSGYCGDGVVQTNSGEVCDYGADNTSAYAGCTEQCTLAARCGDLVVQACGKEACDDGNRIGGDGCSANCRQEQLWVR